METENPLSVVSKLTAPSPTPNYDNEVLQPLKAIQDKAAADKAVADAQAAAVAAQEAASAPVEPAPVYIPSVAPSGSCASWLAGAGITDVVDAMFILTRESGCNPNAINSSSGACGLGQALPCSKMGCALGDGQCQMVWFRDYVVGRYGSFAAAAGFWALHGWY